MSEITLLRLAVQANPTEETPVAMLADALAEHTGDHAAAAAEAAEVARAAAERAAAVQECGGDGAAADRLLRARSLVDGVAVTRPHPRHSWRTVTRRTNGRVRGNLCRLAGAVGMYGRVISSTRFQVIPGDAAPTYEGEGWHYTTTTGVVVRHPNAYRRVAKSARLVYHPSSHVVTVGADWVLAHAAELEG